MSEGGKCILFWAKKEGGTTFLLFCGVALMNNGSNEMVQNTTLPSSLVVPSPQINGTISSSGNLGISAPVTMFGNSTIQFAVTNGVGTNILNCNGSSLAVTTHSSTIDNGSGSMSLGGNITISDISNGTPGCHVASAPAPSGSTNYWFIPIDPNNSTNKISSSSPIPPRSIRIISKNMAITGAVSNIVMRVATTSGSGVATNNYGGCGYFATTNASGTGVQNNNINTQSYIYILTGSTLSTSTGGGRGLTGFLIFHGIFQLLELLK